MNETRDPENVRRLWYLPNPAHKTQTTEAGPPRRDGTQARRRALTR